MKNVTENGNTYVEKMYCVLKILGIIFIKLVLKFNLIDYTSTHVNAYLIINTLSYVKDILKDILGTPYKERTNFCG